MTKVTLHYDTSHTMNDEELSNVAALHGVFGMARVSVAPSLDRLTVDYDASRLSRKEVESILARFSVPVKN